MVRITGGSGTGWYFGGKHYETAYLLLEAVNEELNKLDLQLGEEKKISSARNQIAYNLEQEVDRLNRLVGSLQNALLEYGTHRNRCALFPAPSGKKCDCGLAAAYDGSNTERPKDDRRCPKCRWLPQYCECADKRNCDCLGHDHNGPEVCACCCMKVNATKRSDLHPMYICPLCYHRRDSEEHKLCEKERAVRHGLTGE